MNSEVVHVGTGRNRIGMALYIILLVAKPTDVPVSVLYSAGEPCTFLWTPRTCYLILVGEHLLKAAGTTCHQQNGPPDTCRYNAKPLVALQQY